MYYWASVSCLVSNENCHYWSNMNLESHLYLFYSKVTALFMMWYILKIIIVEWDVGCYQDKRFPGLLDSSKMNTSKLKIWIYMPQWPASKWTDFLHIISTIHSQGHWWFWQPFWRSKTRLIFPINEENCTTSAMKLLLEHARWVSYSWRTSSGKDWWKEQSPLMSLFKETSWRSLISLLKSCR